VRSDRASGRFDASVSSLGPIRRLVAETVSGWDCEPILDDAVLCASELASNAILHTRLPFEVEVSKSGTGVRIEVTDRRPQEMPALVPDKGLAMDITAHGTTGRGLQIVATLADRWGVTSDARSKTVWVELGPESAPVRASPIMVQHEPPRTDPDELVLQFRSLPVRAAVASGMHLDGLVRELQLAVGDSDDPLLKRLYDLLDRSAPVRLEGRRLALQAASRDEQRYDLTVHTTRSALAAVGAVDEVVHELADGHRAAPLPPGVAALRAWLRDETMRQLAGEPPTPCPLH